MIQTERWPVDVDALKKGDVISVEQLERIIGKPRTSPSWGLDVLGVRNLIMRLLERQGRTLTIRQSQRNLVVCDDPEASTYNERETEAGFRKSIRAHRRNLFVDVARLDEARRDAHDRVLLTHGRMIHAMNKARPDPELKPTERTTPLLKTDEPA